MQVPVFKNTEVLCRTGGMHRSCKHSKRTHYQTFIHFQVVSSGPVACSETRDTSTAKGLSPRPSNQGHRNPRFQGVLKCLLLHFQRPKSTFKFTGRNLPLSTCGPVRDVSRRLDPGPNLGRSLILIGLQLILPSYMDIYRLHVYLEDFLLLDLNITHKKINKGSQLTCN